MEPEDMNTQEFEQAKREFAEKWCIKVIECMKGDDYIMHAPDEMLPDLTALLEQHKEVILYEQKRELTELKKKLGLLKESMKNDELGMTTNESKSYPTEPKRREEMKTYWDDFNEQYGDACTGKSLTVILEAFYLFCHNSLNKTKKLLELNP